MSADGRTEKRISSLETSVTQLHNGLELVKVQVADTNKDIMDFRSEWRASIDSRNNEEKTRRDAAQSRRATPVQWAMVVFAGGTFVTALLAGFFFLTKAYVDGTVTPVLTQITERQSASSEASLQQREVMERLGSGQGELRASMAELARTSTDNRKFIEDHDAALGEHTERLARIEERAKAEEQLRLQADMYEGRIRDLNDADLRRP